MSPWTRGSDEVDALLAARHLKRVTGADVGTRALMKRAQQLITSARSLVESDPVTAYIVAYDAAKHAGAALLAEQNLRATGEGGHVAIERTLDAQFGPPFARFGGLRRRRNELDYPASAEDFADEEEARQAILRAAEVVDNAAKVIEQGILIVY